MAEGGVDLLSDSLKKLDAELTCPVCTEHFKEPKVLPCLHYYCKTCISDLIKRAKGQPFNCPECRRETQAAGNDPESIFPESNGRCLFGYEKADPKQCPNCESCSELPSVSFCYNCKEYICTDCVQYHKQIHKLSSRKVVSIKSLRSNISKVPTSAHTEVVKYKLACMKHEDEPLKLYCRECHKLVCRDCILIEHRDHKYAFVTDAASLSKLDIIEKCEAVKKISGNVYSVVSSLEVSDKMLSTHERATGATTDNIVDKIVAKAEEKRRELKEKTGKIMSEAREKVTAQKKNAELAVGEVESLVEFMNRTLERATDQEILSLEKQMSDQVERVSQLYGNPADKFPVPTLPELAVSVDSCITKTWITVDHKEGGESPGVVVAQNTGEDKATEPHRALNQSRNVSIKSRLNEVNVCGQDYNTRWHDELEDDQEEEYYDVGDPRNQDYEDDLWEVENEEDARDQRYLDYEDDPWEEENEEDPYEDETQCEGW